MKKSTKKSNPTKKYINDAKEAAFYLDEYRNCFDWRVYPISQRFIEDFSRDMIQWALKTPNAIRVEEFIRSKGVERKTFLRWRNKYPQLQESFEEAMHLIAMNRERLGLERKLDTGMIERSMPIYEVDNPDAPKTYWQMMKLRSAMKAQANASTTGTIQVIIPPIENSPLVPEKKKE